MMEKMIIANLRKFYKDYLVKNARKVCVEAKVRFWVTRTLVVPFKNSRSLFNERLLSRFSQFTIDLDKSRYLGTTVYILSNRWWNTVMVLQPLPPRWLRMFRHSSNGLQSQSTTTGRGCQSRCSWSSHSCSASHTTSRDTSGLSSRAGNLLTNPHSNSGSCIIGYLIGLVMSNVIFSSWNAVLSNDNT